MEYGNLKAQITGNITSNNANQITGEILRNVMVAMVDSLGRGYQFMGFATPTTNPGTPDQKVFYIAQTDGTYVNFGGLQVVGVNFLFWDTQWSAVQLNVSSGGGGGGTGITSLGLNMPSMFEVDPAVPLTQNGTFNVTLKSTYTIPTAEDWNDVFSKRHTHSNKGVLDGIGSTEISHWNAAYNAIAGLSAKVSMNAPLVRIKKGSQSTPNQANPYASYIRFEHPLLEVGGEVVLMVRQKRNRKKVGTAQFETNNYHWPCKGWAVAKGWTGGDKWIFKPSSNRLIGTTPLIDLQQYIVQHYTQLGLSTRTQMENTSYVSWCNSALSVSFGFDNNNGHHTRKSPKWRKMFGIAIRIVNPDWIEYAGGSPTEHTQGIMIGSTIIPRYLYTDVAPMVAGISEDDGSYHYKLGLMPL